MICIYSEYIHEGLYLLNTSSVSHTRIIPILLEALNSLWGQRAAVLFVLLQPVWPQAWFCSSADAAVPGSKQHARNEPGAKVQGWSFDCTALLLSVPKGNKLLYKFL